MQKSFATLLKELINLSSHSFKKKEKEKTAKMVDN